jgi:hypothetical protein
MRDTFALASRATRRSFFTPIDIPLSSLPPTGPAGSLPSYSLGGAILHSDGDEQEPERSVSASPPVLKPYVLAVKLRPFWEDEERAWSMHALSLKVPCG